MDGFQLSAMFLAIIAAAGWLNARFLRLPTATIMVIAGLFAGALLLVGRLTSPQPNAASMLARLIGGVDFPETVLGYMLAFLLFAGAMQVDMAELRKRTLTIFTLSTLGVVVSTVLVGAGLWLAAQGLGIGLPLAWALVFGALISPTDPVAVLAAVREGSLSKSLQAVLQGEALFNDGVGIVVFSAALAVASGEGRLHPMAALGQAALQALGGAGVGVAAAWLAIAAMRAIDDYGVEVGISIALAAGVYALAQAVGFSGAIGVVAAGLLLGNHGVRTAMSDLTQRYVNGFWTLVDDVLNALLFLLLGLQMLVVPLDLRQAGLWAVTIALVVAARLMVVLPWGAFFHFREGQRGAVLLLSWGGLHGALSLALALTVPPGPWRALILSTTFAVVIMSVVVQGLTFAPLARRLAATVQSPDDTAPTPRP